MKQGRVCSNCLPARTRACQNPGTIPGEVQVPDPQPPATTLVPAPQPLAVPSPDYPPLAPTSILPAISPPRVDDSTTPTPPDSSPPLQRLPSWNTLQHVPKGARNAWADLISNIFSAINANPSNPDNWLKLFLLPRCVLANPRNGDRLGWRALQEIVRQRIRK